MGRQFGHPGHRMPQRRYWLCSGTPSGTGPRRAARLATPTAKVVRDGKLKTIPTRELVPGDIIHLEAGDHVPADGRLLEAFALRTQEAALTGESVPQDKSPDVLLDLNASLGDRKNMVYLGTVVAAGKARAVVVATGMNTELGRIAGLLQQTQAEPTPLQRRLTELGRILLILVLAVIAIVFTLQILRGGEVLEVFMLSVSLAVAAVPEGLPAVVTVGAGTWPAAHGEAQRSDSQIAQR